jgi:hypothetical protein
MVVDQKPFHVTSKWMKLPSRKQAKLVEIFGRFNSKQKLTQLVGHGWWHPFGVAVFVELFKPFMANTDKSHTIASWIQYVRLYRTCQERSRLSETLHVGTSTFL